MDAAVLEPLVAHKNLFLLGLMAAHVDGLDRIVSGTRRFLVGPNNRPLATLSFRTSIVPKGTLVKHDLSDEIEMLSEGTRSNRFPQDQLARLGGYAHLVFVDVRRVLSCFVDPKLNDQRPIIAMMDRAESMAN